MSMGSAETERSVQFSRLAGSIDLLREENYDCSLLDVWSYRRKNEVRDGVVMNFGNMCNGYPFRIGNTLFKNSECAYIAGAPGRLSIAGEDADSYRRCASASSEMTTLIPVKEIISVLHRGRKEEPDNLGNLMRPGF